MLSFNLRVSSIEPMQFDPNRRQVYVKQLILMQLVVNPPFYLKKIFHRLFSFHFVCAGFTLHIDIGLVLISSIYTFKD